MSGASTSEPLSSFIVVDVERRVVESNIEEFPAGEIVTRASWLGEAALDAIDAASRARKTHERIARDYAQGAHWIVRAAIVGADPWRARVVAQDATLAVAADRHAILASVVHSVRNTGFALTSVLDALVLERPGDAVLGEYISHLREPADRLAAIMARVAAFLLPRPPVLASISVGTLTETAIGRVAPPARPKSVHLVDRGMRVAGDLDLLAEAVAAMIESTQEADTVLEIERADEGARPHVRIRIGRRASPAEQREPLALWDLGDGHRVDTRVRLSAARVAVAAHGGRVTAAMGARGFLWIGALIPLTDD